MDWYLHDNGLCHERVIDPLLVTPAEIFDYFIDLKEDLTREADLYIELPERATA